MNPNTVKAGVALLILSAAALFIGFDLDHYFTFEHLKSRYLFYQQYCEQHLLLSLGIYTAVLFLLTAFSVPGIIIFMVAGGALFGFTLTFAATTFTDAIGSTLAFLSSRYLFYTFIRKRFARQLARINSEAESNWGVYLFSMRLMPFLPCVLINLVMGLTKIPLKTFYLATQAGKMPYIIIYINAGTQLSKIDSVNEIFSPAVLVSFVLIGLFPLITRKGAAGFRRFKKKV